MDLRDFIKTSIVDILGGIEDAAKEFGEGKTNLGGVNPRSQDNAFEPEKIAFDIAVSAGSERKNGGKAGLKIYVVEAGVDGHDTQSESTVSRLQFTVPVALPAQIIKPARQAQKV